MYLLVMDVDVSRDNDAARPKEQWNFVRGCVLSRGRKSDVFGQLVGSKNQAADSRPQLASRRQQGTSNSVEKSKL